MAPPPEASGNTIRIPTSDGILFTPNCQFGTVTGNSVITPGANTQYYGDGSNPQGATAVPAITGTKYGVNVDASCYQMVVVGNNNMLAYNNLPKSTSTAYSAAVYAGPVNVSNNETNGNGDRVAGPAITAISTGNINTAGGLRVYLNVAAGGTITAINGGNHGDTVVFYNGSTAVTINNGASIKLSGGANMTLAFDKSITLQNVDDVWYEVSRTV